MSDGYMGPNGHEDTFDDAFPTVDTLTVEITERSLMGEERELQYSADNMPTRISCTNSDCYSPDVHLDMLLTDLVRNKSNSKEFTEHCQGSESKTKDETRTCDRVFDIEFNVTY